MAAEDHEIPVRIFSPQTTGEFPVLLFFHGGGWVTGNIDSYDKVCTNMAQITKHQVVSVDYRLAPEYPFPAGLNAVSYTHLTGTDQNSRCYKTDGSNHRSFGNCYHNSFLHPVIIGKITCFD